VQIGLAYLEEQIAKFGNCEKAWVQGHQTDGARETRRQNTLRLQGDDALDRKQPAL